MPPPPRPSPFHQSPSAALSGLLEEVAAALFATDPLPARIVQFGSTPRSKALLDGLDDEVARRVEI